VVNTDRKVALNENLAEEEEDAVVLSVVDSLLDDLLVDTILALSDD
jgi:hypothetical protein